MKTELHYQELMWGGTPLDSSSIEAPRVQNSPDCPSQTTSADMALRAESSALLLVDIQPEYWSNCPAVRRDFQDSFPHSVTNLLRIARERSTKVIWVRADYRYSHSPWLQQFHRIHQGRIPAEVTCNADEGKVEWESFATPLPNELVLTKTSWSSTQNTSLLHSLHSSGIDTVLVCGLITSVCVQHSAFGIFEAGFRTLLVTDCCADRGRARHNAALALYGDYMYELVTVEDLRKTLQQSKERENVSGFGGDGTCQSKMEDETVSLASPRGVIHSVSADSLAPLSLE